MRKGQNISTARILDVLSKFALSKTEFGVTELSDMLGMTKNMIYRALATLVEQGFLIRDRSGRRYQISFRVLEFQNPYFPVPDIRSMAYPFLQRLNSETGMMAQLSVRAGAGQVVVDGVEAQGIVVTRTKLGQYFPLHAPAASRAILASLPDEEIWQYIKENSPLKRFTDNTLVSPGDLWKDVEATRKRGYAVAFEDYYWGTWGVAFAIAAADGDTHGAISIGGRVSSENPRLEELVSKVAPIMEELQSITRLYDTS